MSKDILKNSLTYTILGFLPLSFSFLFTPIYLKYLSPEEYGLLNLFMLYAGFLAQFYTFGTNTAFGYLYWDVYKEKEKLKALISSTLGLILFIQLIIAIIAYFSGEFLLVELLHADSQLGSRPILLMMIAFSAFSVFYELFLYLYRNEGKIRSYSILSISTLLLLTIGTLITVVVLDMKAVGAILGRTIAYALIIGLFILIMIRRFGLSLKASTSKQLLKFGFPVFINALIGAIAFGADRLFIERFADLESLGIYGLALVVVTVIEIWFNALNNAISPTLYRLMNESMHEKKKEINGLADLVIFSVSLLICIVIVFTQPVMDLLFTEVYHQAAIYIPILATAFIWRVMSAMCTYSIYLEKKTKVLLVNQLINLVVFLLCAYPAYQEFGLSGIALAVLLTRITEFVILKILSNRIKRLPISFGKFTLLSIALSCSGLLCTIFIDGKISPYLLFALPLVVLLGLFPILLNKELKNILYVIKERKNLF